MGNKFFQLNFIYWNFSTEFLNKKNNLLSMNTKLLLIILTSGENFMAFLMKKKKKSYENNIEFQFLFSLKFLLKNF